MKVKSLSRVRLFTTPWSAAYQAPLSMGFSRQENWSRVPLPSLWFVLSNRKKGCYLVGPFLAKLVLEKAEQVFVVGFAASGGKGNGTPLQYSCLENPMDGGAW